MYNPRTHENRWRQPTLQGTKTLFYLIIQAKEVESQVEELGNEITVQVMMNHTNRGPTLIYKLAPPKKAFSEYREMWTSNVITKQHKYVVQQQKVLLLQYKETVHKMLCTPMTVSPVKKK